MKKGECCDDEVLMKAIEGRIMTHRGRGSGGVFHPSGFPLTVPPLVVSSFSYVGDPGARDGANALFPGCWTLKGVAAAA